MMNTPLDFFVQGHKSSRSLEDFNRLENNALFLAQKFVWNIF